MAEEKQQSRQASLTLQVMNGNELESGRAAKCLFSENGGDIGHTPECHWQVQDRAGSIAARACTFLFKTPRPPGPPKSPIAAFSLKKKKKNT